MARNREARDRRLSAIVFTDIVGFSAVVNRNEAEGERLLHRHRRVVRRLLGGFGGREIETGGDSFLLEFASALAAMRCVVAIHQGLDEENLKNADAPPIRLRASIHVGDVEHRGRDIFGDGVNISARIMSLSPAGGVALSDQAWAQIRHRLEAEPSALGPQQLKNIRHPVDVFLLDSEQLRAIPAESRVREDDRRSASAAALAATRNLRLAAAFGITALVAASAFTYSMIRSPGDSGGHIASAPLLRRTIAVLPFSSFSTGQENDLLAFGIQDAVLTNLARIDALHVISRTSVMQYKDQSSRNLKQIAQDLGVGAILEGSIQREGGRLLVQVQLIDAASDEHLWAQSYDRQVDDLFEVEGSISRQVAEAVQGHLADPVVAAIDKRPTSSVEAYSEYLRAKRLYEQEDPTQLPEMERALNAALAMDPKFALAHVLLSRVYVRAYFTNDQRDEAQLLKIKDQLIQASEVQPNLPELHLGWGFYYQYGRRDLSAAAAEFEKSLQLMPSNPDALRSLGAIDQERGELGEALIYQKRALEIDPGSLSGHEYLLDTFQLMRDYGAIEQELSLAEHTLPGAPGLKTYRVGLALNEKGDIAAARAAAEGLDDPYVHEKVAYYAGDLDEAIRQVKLQPEWTNSMSGSAPYPSELTIAADLWLKGDAAAAKALYAKAAPELELALRLPDASHWDQMADLAIANAALGRTQEARDALKRINFAECCESPVTRNDVWIAVAYADLLLGDRDATFAALNEVLTKPSFMSANLVRLDPAWQPLRDDPRFADLLARATLLEHRPS